MEEMRQCKGSARARELPPASCTPAGNASSALDLFLMAAVCVDTFALRSLSLAQASSRMACVCPQGRVRRLRSSRVRWMSDCCSSSALPMIAPSVEAEWRAVAASSLWRRSEALQRPLEFGSCPPLSIVCRAIGSFPPASDKSTVAGRPDY